MSYQPTAGVYRRPVTPAVRRANIPRTPPAHNAVGFGGFPVPPFNQGLGASAGVTVAQTAVSSIPVVGPLLSNIVGPLASIFDPGAKRDAGRKQRLNGIVALANEGSLLAARQLYGGAERGAVGAASEKALYQSAWANFQSAHPDLATAAKAAGAAGVGADPVNGWQPPAADLAQYQQEITAYRSGGIVATAQQAAGARLDSAGLTGKVGLAIALGLVGAFVLKGGRR